MITAPLVWVLAFCSPGASITDCHAIMSAPSRAACRKIARRQPPHLHARCLRMPLTLD